MGKVGGVEGFMGDVFVEDWRSSLDVGDGGGRVLSVLSIFLWRNLISASREEVREGGWVGRMYRTIFANSRWFYL